MSSDWQPRLPPRIRVALIDVDEPGARVLDDPALISPEEAARARRFRGESLERRYRRAHAALRLLLSRETGCAPALLPISTRDGGKPFLPGSTVSFNLSHSGPLAAVALASGLEVGVDVEAPRRLHGDALSLAARFYHPEECRMLTAVPGRGREAAFLRLWTARESLVKALGAGLDQMPGDFNAAPLLEGAQAVEWGGWTVRVMPAPAGAFAAVAAPGAGWGYELVSPFWLA
ncbi:MAG: 4'-phosphopantetheinyl transferase superfamily protein [Candidatus Solibacter usitatus]|nr:4'-phosphopantetheinyl transferase superfamily protein [Candidatus Solibacter usitatus]